MYPVFSSFFLVLVMVGCDTFRIFARSLSLLFEFFISSYKSFIIFSFGIATNS